MTCEETEAREVEIIGQDTQTAKQHIIRPTWGSSTPRLHQVSKTTFPPNPPFKTNKIVYLFLTNCAILLNI